MESWIRLVKLVLISPVEHLLATLDDDIWVRGRSQVSARKVVSFKEVKSDDTFTWSGELLREHGIITGLEQEL